MQLPVEAHVLLGLYYMVNSGSALSDHRTQRNCRRMLSELEFCFVTSLPVIVLIRTSCTRRTKIEELRLFRLWASYKLTPSLSK